MLDGIAILAVMFGLVFMITAYLRCRRENEALREKLDIKVLEEQAREKVLVEKIRAMQLPFLVRDNTNLKTGFDVAKTKAIKLIQGEFK